VRLELSRFGPQAGLAELVARWPEAVGTAIARNAWPSRIARDGTLHVSTSDSVWAFELGHRADEVAGRLGVSRVRFSPGPIPRDDPATPLPPALRPTAEQEAYAASVAALIEDEKTRQSVQKAVLLSLARDAADRPLW
jgi:hypothetical protein